MQLCVFARYGDADMTVTVFDALDHRLPVAEVGSGCVNAKLAADNIVKPFAVQHERSFIKAGKGEVFDHAVRLNIAEKRDFFFYRAVKRLIGACYDYIGRNSH